MSERPIQFYFRGEIHAVQGAAPTRTLLQYLREDLHQTGTKEGCAEGDCGACTVVVGELAGEPGREELRLRAVNACIQFLPALDGKALFTVEDLAPAAADLHPVQQALVDRHGSQCGFCTPGFAMSLFALYENRDSCPPRDEIDHTLSGNLCRCTGYRPIIDAARDAYALPRRPLDRQPVIAALRQLAALPPLDYVADGRRSHSPRTLAELAALRLRLPEARLVAGGTDVGLWVTKQGRDLGELILLGAVDELKRIRVGDGQLEIGAGVTLTDAFAALTAFEPQCAELARRFASTPVKNAGTLGGNVANGSPIGDSMPALIALGATIVLQRGETTRTLALEDFYLDYQKTALQPGEFVRALRLDAPPAPLVRHFRAWKVAKRLDQDISAVAAGFAVHLDADQVVRRARLAFGGMAATPKRAAAAEAALLGRPWSPATIRLGMAALREDYAPFTDVRASSAYRLSVAANLLQRFWLETAPAGASTVTPLRLAELAPIDPEARQ
ncbi:xanthine dehydrogenase small subunit [Azonexus fungiphilus]|uniref:xanthine dehydrogenase small subunit n=1 Tax=Azonexus fungiphilus TaxID=146940 RepID=UPI001C2BD59A|nr:xanthine dehydrogenase small subunit [Azonexus fungiphilus]NHC05231.1 xanthine dehydrogenase small subunit [Azonexus fungiphilus]